MFHFMHEAVLSFFFAFFVVFLFFIYLFIHLIINIVEDLSIITFFAIGIMASLKICSEFSHTYSDSN